MATDKRTVHGSGAFGPRRGTSGASIAQLAGRARAERADPLRAKIMADPAIRNPEGFLVYLGRRKGGLNSHKGRGSHPGVGTRRLAGHDPSSLTARPRVDGGGDAATVRLSRQDLSRQLRDAAPTMVMRRAQVREAVRRPEPRPRVREADTVALKLPMSQAARAARAKPGGQWTAPKVIPKAREVPGPEPVKLPPELAKLRVGDVRLPGLGKTKAHRKTKLSKRWRLGR
ncbi:hypothetical protein [Frankia sp. AgB32]|uniref:hypothetical protein n=1 Tax=Frankia sp. AgB32 TaxID=631119 RepID=UPI00200EF319|nr:hypothetical protein [Frankia sp. AgB32]MCK9898148.1 hypothetical protein [Frankia sp. AgB32]